MNTTSFPFHLNWTSHDLADAVPLRLHQLLDFDSHREGVRADSANHAPYARRSRNAHGYLDMPALPTSFLIR